MNGGKNPKKKYKNFINPNNIRISSWFPFKKDLQACENVFSTSCCKMISTQINIKVQLELWIPSNKDFKLPPASNHVNLDNKLTMANLLVNNSWNVSALNELFDSKYVNDMLKIQLPLEENENNYIQTKDKNGKHFG